MFLTFTHPAYLSFLFIIPFLFIIHFITLSSKRIEAVKFSNFEAIARIKGIDIYSKNIAILFFSVAIICIMIFSVAGLTMQREILASSSSFVIALDSSRSMEAKDLLPNRLGAAKETAMNFVDSAPVGARIGIISFSGVSYVEQDLTSEKDLIKQALDSVEISTIGGTDLYDPIVTSASLLREENSRALIILSDGRFNVGNLEEAIEYANRNNIIIYAIGIGTSEGGQTTYGLSTLEEGSLKSLAYSTGGKFFLVSSREDMYRSFKEIINLRMGKVFIDLSRQLMMLAILLFVLEYIFINKRYRLF